MEQDRGIILSRRTMDSRWLTIFLFIAGTLASTILLKVGPVQYLEILYFVEMAVLLVIFSENGYRILWFRPYLQIAIWYIFFSSSALVLAIFALRYDFYFPDNLSPLNHPVIITISRIIELSASVSIMLYLAEKFRKDPRKAAFTMRVYFWVGSLSALYSLLTYPINLATGIDLGTYGYDHRMRGFYNEGGPYGLYLISVFLVGSAIYKYGWGRKRTLQFAFVVLSIVFLGSKSKAAFCAALLVLLFNGILAKSFKKRVIFAVSLVLILIAIYQYQIIDMGKALAAYQRASQAYERLSHRHLKDGNFVYGRVAGAFIVPRIVREHPLVGVGWGNYGLVRNAPEYRGAAAFAHLSYDEPALGLVGMTADLGIPLVFCLAVCLFLPFIYLRRIKAPAYLTNLALLQPIVHLFGGQLNLTYPWIVTAFALGLGYSLSTGAKSSDLVTQMP